jgi:hypothetical protein
MLNKSTKGEVDGDPEKQNINSDQINKGIEEDKNSESSIKDTTERSYSSQDPQTHQSKAGKLEH